MWRLRTSWAPLGEKGRVNASRWCAACTWTTKGRANARLRGGPVRALSRHVRRRRKARQCLSAYQANRGPGELPVGRRFQPCARGLYIAFTRLAHLVHWGMVRSPKLIGAVASGARRFGLAGSAGRLRESKRQGVRCGRPVSSRGNEAAMERRQLVAQTGRRASMPSDQAEGVRPGPRWWSAKLSA